MTAANRKNSRLSLPSQMRTLGIIKQSQDISSHSNDRFSIEGYAKQIIPTSSPSNVNDAAPLKKTSSVVSSTANQSDVEITINHTECTKSINELKQQIQVLKKENSQLSSELRKYETDLSNSKLQIDNLKKENVVLQSLQDELEESNAVLKQKHQILSDEFVTSREEWRIDREQLEKNLNEIRRELENKIIEIRSKHSQEIEAFEEKNRLLKNHLTDTLKMRSVERQFEIDRISNELERSQTNEENLRTRLNKIMEQYNSNQKVESQLCGNCMQSIKTADSTIMNKKDPRRFEEIKTNKSNKSVVKSADQKH